MANGKTIRFRPDNQIRYGQDFRQFRGIPYAVDFHIERFGDNKYKLTADGYGSLRFNEKYGNGALYVWGLTAKQRERFERVVMAREVANGGS